MQGLAELNQNLKLVESFTSQALIQGMEKCQNLVAEKAKSNHIAANSLAAGEVVAHDDPRFYTRTGKLVNSIRAEKVKVFVNSLEGDVVAGERYATKIEVGGPNSRAFPYMEPALMESGPACIGILGAAVKSVIK